MKNPRSTLLAVVTLAASICVAQSQTLLLRMPLNDTGAGTSFAPDPAGQANGFTMPSLTSGGVAGNFHGTPGGGVSGLGVALDFSTNSDFTDAAGAAEGGAAGSGPVVEVTNASLNFGFINTFTATVWIKAVTNMPSTNAGPNDGGATGDWNLGPRIFILGTGGTADKSVANSIGMYCQQWNDISFTIGTSQIDVPTFTSPTNAAGDAFVPTNQWLFYAITYDGGNVATIYMGTDQSAVTTVTATTATSGVCSAAQVTAEGALVAADQLAPYPQNAGPGAAGLSPVVLNFTTSASGTNSVLYIGNRQTRARSFCGWIDDFRFYSGTETANGLEDIRWSSVAPTNLAYSLNAQNQPALTWNALGSAASYIILRATTGSYSQIGTSSTPTFTDTTATTGNTYHYEIAAVDAAGDATTSANSPSITVALSPPPPPSVPVVTPTPGNAQVVLNWNASSGTGPSAVATYNVARSTTSGNEVVITNVTAPTTTYTDTNLVNSQQYFYEVNAVSVAGSASAYSTEVNATPVGPPLPPNSSATAFGLSVTVTWTDPNPPGIQAIDSYIILRSINSGPYAQIATPGVGTLSYNDAGLTVGNTYSYEVETVNTDGTSPPSIATAPIQISQQVVVQDIAEQTVRAAADHAGVVNDNGSGTIPGVGAANAVGFLRVKWVADANPAPGVDTTSCAKTYLRWSFAGNTNPPPDTNSDLTLTWTTDAAGVPTTMTLWSLDQSYQFLTGVPTPPGDGSTFVPPGGATNGVTWDNAQANDTNYNPITLTGTFQMLASGPYTATPVASFTATGQVTVPAPVVVIPAPWGNLIHNNELVFCVGGTNIASSQAAAGYRIANHTAALVYNQILGTTPPSISSIPNISLNINQTSPAINFTITDPDGNANSLATALVAVFNDTTGGTTASASSTSGSGATQQLSVTAAPNPGTATVEVTITDEHGDLAQRTFTVTVLPPITISTPANTNVLANASVVVPFTVADNLLHAAQNDLTMTATVDAQSTAVLSTAVAAAVGGDNWTVTVTPTGATNGIGFVDLTVTDPGNYTASTSFAVMVQANAEVVFSDVFNYTEGSSLLLENGSVLGTPPTVNDRIWNEIGPSGPILAVNGNTLDLAVSGNGEEGYANLLGGPYTPGHSYVIYTTFQANWLPGDFSGFTWLSLGAFSGVGAFQYAGVGNLPDLAADGGFNATIVNGPMGAVVRNPEILSTGVTYNIATRYDVDRAIATLWINAANEADGTATSVTGSDIEAPLQISDITLNQNGATGQASVDLNDLTISVLSKPIITGISLAGSTVHITFAAGVNDVPSSFGLTSTADLTVPFAIVPGPTITPLGGSLFQATVPVAGNDGFYEVYRQPFAFSY